MTSVKTRPVADVAAPTLVTRDYITTWLRANGYSYFVDCDGDIGGIWDNRMFHFLILGGGNALQIRGQWNRLAGIGKVPELLDFTNKWNMERIWPKAFVRVRDDGAVVVCGDLTITISSGLSLSQLDLQLKCGLATACVLFDTLDEEFPDPVRAAR